MLLTTTAAVLLSLAATPDADATVPETALPEAGEPTGAAAAAQEQLPRCLRALNEGKAPAAISVDEGSVVVEHSCASWCVSPVPLRDVRVVEAIEGGEGGALRSRLSFNKPDQEPVLYEVGVGDRLSGGARVVGMAPGIVLIDVDGVLTVATDGQTVDDWRMVYHSRFGVPAPSKGGGGSGSVARKPSAKAGKVAPKAAKRLADKKAAAKRKK